MVGGIAVFVIRIGREADHIGDRGSSGIHKTLRDDLLALPSSTPQVKDAEPSHRIHVRMDACSEFTPLEAVDSMWTIGVLTPLQILRLDAEWFEYPPEQEGFEILSVNERDTFCQPVWPPITIVPPGTRLKK